MPEKRTSTSDSENNRIAIIRNAVKSPGSASIKPTSEEIKHLPANYSRLDKTTENETHASTKLKRANELILEKISEFDLGSIILGFLPLSMEEEDELIEAVKEGLNDHNLYGRLRVYPAATCYFLAVATSRQCASGKEFWPKLCEFTGLELKQNNNHEKLAKAFTKTCAKLDLLEGSLQGAAWVNVAPFFFQAGILHRWSEPLARALKTILAIHPAPNLEDQSEVTKFIQKICGNSHLNSKKNLKHTLQSEVGPLLIQRLVVACEKSNWKTLPAHLEKPISDAFELVGRGAFIHTPYLKYNEAFGETELVLPAQNGQLATCKTTWEVAGRTYNAMYETTLPASHLDEGEVIVELKGLENELTERSYHVQTGLTNECPFKIFQLGTGREKKFDQAPRIKLPPDDYLIVMQENMTAGEDEVLAEVRNQAKLLELSLRPGDAPILLFHGDRNWEIGSILKPGFYTNLDVADIIREEDGSEIFYGESFGIIGYFPKPPLGENIELVTRCEERNLEFKQELIVPEDAASELQFTENIEDSLDTLRQALNYGIHKVRLRLSQSNKSIVKEFWIWKGLNTINLSHGFNCDRLPENLDLSHSVGLFEKEGALYFQPDNLSPFFKLKLTAPDVSLKIPRPGVEVLLLDSDQDAEILHPGQLLTLSKNDNRKVQLRSGGFEQWKVFSGNRLLVILNQKHRSNTMSLSALAAETGHSGTISVENSAGNRHKLFTYSLPLSSTQPQLDTDHINKIEAWSFKVATEELHSLGYRIADLSDSPDLEFSPVREFITKEKDTYAGAPHSLIEGIVTLSAYHQIPENERQHSRIKVSLALAFEELTNRLYAIDIYRRTNVDGEWLPLECEERQKNGEYNSSTLRFFAWGDQEYAEDSNYWEKLRRADIRDESECLTRSIQSMTEHELDRALTVSRKLLSFKYPTNVWHANAKRLPNLITHLSKHRFDTSQEIVSLWWKHAAQEIIEHSSARSTAVLRNFIFAARPELICAVASQKADEPILENSIAGCALALPGNLRTRQGKLQYILEQEDQINRDLIPAFQNFIQVQTGQATDLRSFSLDTFLETGDPSLPSLAANALDRNEHRLVKGMPALLSPEHLLLCIRPLNSRCRTIQDTIDQYDNLILQQTRENSKTPWKIEAAQEIEAAHQHVDQQSPVIAKMLGWRNHEASLWTPPLLKTEIAVKIARLTWCVTALARLSANGHPSSQEFKNHLAHLLCRDNATDADIRRMLNTILNLAPELFSFYIALFELSIDTKD